MARRDTPRSMADETYAEAMTWSPQAPRYRLLHVLLSWLVAGVAVFIAAAIVPGVSVGNFGDALAAAVADRCAQRGAAAAGGRASPAVHAGARVRDRARARRADPAAGLAHHHADAQGQLVRLGSARGARHLRGDARARRDPRRQRRRHLLAARDPADRAPAGRAGEHRHARDPVPRDRRSGPAGAPARDARRQRAAHGPLARGGDAPADRVGARPQLPDRRQPGRHPARVQRGHPGLPLGREGQPAR